MPIYTYRREDGTTFDYRQKFTDDALTVDPETGQHVSRVIQPAGVIFKGSGFYINDSKSASRSTISGTPKNEKGEKSETTASAEKSDHSDKSEKSEKSDKAEKKESAESKPAAASTESAPKTKAAATAAAD